MSIPTDRFERVSSHIENVFPLLNAPGLAFGVVTKDGEKQFVFSGVTNIHSQKRITKETKFQIGSISKAFASICLLKYAERGQLNLEDPITKYLPWFTVRGDHAPIRIVDLMSHTAGIISSVDRSLSPLVEVMRLRDTEAVTAPGERFYYSNVGYKVLGLVIEALSGKRVDEAIEQDVLQPLGMTNAKAAFTNEDRATLAAGHIPFYDDRPCPAGGELAIAPWFENNCADGSIIATIDDMTRYAQALLKEMKPVLQAESFFQLTSPRVATGDGTHGQQYGLGLFLDDLWGHQVIGHSGGMVGYSSDMLVDLDAGIGVVALTNGDVDASVLTKAALAILQNLTLPKELLPNVIPISLPMDGVFRTQSGHILMFGHTDDSLYLQLGHGHSSSIINLGDGKWLAPEFDPIFPLKLREDEDGQTIVEWGGYVYTRDQNFTGPIAHLDPRVEGHFRSYNPWLSNFRIIDRLGKLFLIHPNGDEFGLYPVGEDTYAIGDVLSPERITFGDHHDGLAQTAIISGQEYNRVFTP